jgi:hypothetical protein
MSTILGGGAGGTIVVVVVRVATICSCGAQAASRKHEARRQPAAAPLVLHNR